MPSDVNVQSLLDKIKKEGIEEAQKASEEIIEKARAEAASIIERAEKEAESIVSVANDEVHRLQESFEAAMNQAARNLILSLKAEIIRLCDHVLERELAASLTPEVMEEMILKIIEKWSLVEQSPKLEILLSDKDRQRIEDMLLHSLQGAFKKGVTLKPLGKIRAGFRIGEKNGHMHYDLTHKGIAETLREYLNPRIAKFLDQAS